jgi:methyl-accepting chemotaxis protein
LFNGAMIDRPTIDRLDLRSTLSDKITVDSLDLRPKLILAFVLVACLVAITGAVGYTSVTTVDANGDSIKQDAEKLDTATELIVAVEREQQAIQAGRLGGQGARQRFERANTRFGKKLQQLEASSLQSDQETLVAELASQHREYSDLAAEFFDATTTDDSIAAQKAARLASLSVDIEETATTLKEASRAEMERSAATADTTRQQAELTILGLTVGSFIVAIGIGLFVAGRFTTPITQLSEAAIAARDGDLDTDIDDHAENDELGRLVDAFAEMQANLRDVFAEIDAVSQSLEAGALDTDVETDYPGAYGGIMQRLDSGIDQLTASFDEIRQASEGLQQGDLNQSIESDRPGQYGAVLDGLTEGTTQLSESFTQISSASEGLKTGDLDQEIETDYPGAYGRVLDDLSDGIGRLSESVESVQRIADDVAASSAETTASIEEIETASEEVANSIEEIAAGTDDQNERLQQVAGEMNDLSATVEEIASSAEAVAATASSAADRGETGRTHAGDASEGLESIERRAEGAAEQVQQLDAKMDEIGEIVELIGGIAEQTNMLALNASIEAVRAGEAGDGFEVVANEIKGLAEEAADATTEIEARIEEVQNTTTSTVDEMAEMRATVESGTETIEDAIEMFDDIANAVQKAEREIKEISDATDDQAASAEEVVAMVDEVTSVSQQTAAEASNVSAATEEQASSLSEASENIQQMASLAGDLREQVAGFDVGTAADPDSVADPAMVAADGDGVHSLE